MDQKPFAQHNQQPPPARPRIRIRAIIFWAFLLFFGYCLYGPSSSPLVVQDSSSPVYKHDRKTRFWPGWPGIKHIFFFGDSYTSTRFLPNNGAPTEANPFGNPPYPGNVSHKRPLWSDYVVGSYNHSFIKAINLAWGGATVDDQLIVPFIDVIEGLNRQVKNNYLDKYKQQSFFPWNSYDTLHVFWFGINDVNGAWLWENRTDVWARDLATYADNVEKVYQSGARNFLFFNVPPVERAPVTLALKKDLQERKSGEILKWNDEVFRIVHDFTKLHNDTTTFWWDAYASYTEVLDNPCSHKETCPLKDVTTACPEYARLLGLEVLKNWEQNEPACEFPLKNYFWMDELHHGYHMHEVTAKGVVKQMLATPKNWYSF